MRKKQAVSKKEVKDIITNIMKDLLAQSKLNSAKGFVPNKIVFARKLMLDAITKLETIA